MIRYAHLCNLIQTNDEQRVNNTVAFPERLADELIQPALQPPKVSQAAVAQHAH